MEKLFKYILKRLLSLIPILIGISFISFALIYFTGGDAVAVRYEAIGGVLSPELINQKREELGLNRPFIIQYISWLLGVIQGDMGISYVSGRPVFGYIFSKLPNTLLLSISSLLTTLIISLPLGILSAVKKNSVFDNIIKALSFVGNSLPNFFVALAFIYFCITAKTSAGNLTGNKYKKSDTSHTYSCTGDERKVYKADSCTHYIRTFKTLCDRSKSQRYKRKHNHIL